MEKENVKKWVRSVVSALVGAVLSFCVTFGIVDAQKAQELKTQLDTIDQTTEELLGALEARDIEKALELAKGLTKATKGFIEDSKEAFGKTEEALAEEPEVKEPEVAEETK